VTESTAPDYQPGFPDKAGWYDVLVDGVEDRMVFRFCGTCGLWVWQDIHGVKQDNKDVLWMPGSWAVTP